MSERGSGDEAARDVAHPMVGDGALEQWSLPGVTGDLDLRAVRYFVVVAQELHYGRAAARLDLSQSGLSRSISALERQLAVRLLSRTRRGVTLTSAGERLSVHGRSLLRQQAAALEALRPFSNGASASAQPRAVGPRQAPQ